MFPNVRLIVVAILAAITGIGCGLGLFATFRINHEPLARLAEGSPPLQLAFDNRALGSDARTPMEARLPVNGAAKVTPVPVIIATPSPAAEQAGANSTITGDSSVQQAAAGAIAVDQSNTASVALSSLAVAVPAEQSSVTPEAVAPGQQEAVAAVPDQQPAEQSAAVNAAAEDQQPAAKPTKSEESEAAKPAARVSRPAAPARRAAKAVRARRTVAMVAAQPTYQYSQPTYAWTDGTAQASRSVKRVQIKRHRTAKKAPAVQSNPSAATAGLSTQ